MINCIIFDFDVPKNPKKHSSWDRFFQIPAGCSSREATFAGWNCWEAIPLGGGQGARGIQPQDQPRGRQEGCFSRIFWVQRNQRYKKWCHLSFYPFFRFYFFHIFKHVFFVDFLLFIILTTPIFIVSRGVVVHRYWFGWFSESLKMIKWSIS